MQATLLVELLTEELPPKSLKALSEAFAGALANGLRDLGFLTQGSEARSLATPRRLAVSIPGVLDRSPDKALERQGPPIAASAQAIAGFARKNGVAVDALVQVDTAKGRVFAYRAVAPGAPLESHLAAEVDKALRRLPIPKVMRWGSGDAQFVRPVHGLVMMHGTREVPGTVLGVAASSTTRGHRFLGARSIALRSADEYESRLHADGMVIADFETRRNEIRRQLTEQANLLHAGLGDYETLLDEVTALVEFPAVYAGAFDPAYLKVPAECLILTMRQNQKYFPLFGADGALLPKFLIVSNMRVADPRHIVGGNERVVRPRLEDARFFYDLDRRTRLEARVPGLSRVVYHNKLGSQLERVERLQLLAGTIARRLGDDPALAERAAWLSKADLLTGMVGEFPELQGVMGRYYARHDGEPPEVCEAIAAHYRPRFAGDELPQGKVAAAVALADRLDAMTGMFAAGGAPTGEKDPYGMRRAALGVVRILSEGGGLALELPQLLQDARAGFGAGRIPEWVPQELYRFCLERLRHHLREGGYAADEIESVLGQAPARIDPVPARLLAVKAFRTLPESASLAAANKRIRNILRKSEASEAALEPGLLREPEEKTLYEAVRACEPKIGRYLAAGDYGSSLRETAALELPVNAFFDKVMVNAEDAKIRANRHALLRRLASLMNQVADISALAR